MPLNVATGVACPIPGLGPKGITITLPGGVQLGAMTSALYASEAEVSRAMLAQVGVALAPLKPLFDVLAAVLAIIEVLGAVASLNPVKIAKELKAAAQAFAALAKLIPQVSLPLLLAHVLDLLVTVLRGLQAEVRQVVTKQADIDRLATAIVNANDPLNATLDCARRLNQMRMCAVDESMAPLAPLFDLLNLFFKLLGLGALTAPGPLGHDPTRALEAIEVLIDAIRGIRRGLPAPPLVAAPRC